MAKTTFKGLLRDTIEAVEASKVPIRSVEYDPATKRLRVELFDRTQTAAQAPLNVPVPSGSLAERIQDGEVKMVPGTSIPDDNSPVSDLDIVLAKPGYRLDAEPRRTADPADERAA